MTQARVQDNVKRTRSRLTVRRCIMLTVGIVVMAALIWGAYHFTIGTVRPDYPNVIIISIDTLRRDHCSLYGYPRSTTPSMHQAAKQGATCEQAYAPMAATAPSHATMFTGMYPIGHRLIKNGVVLDNDNETLAEILSEHGFDTAAFLGGFPLHSVFGLSQGFDLYDDEFLDDESTWPELLAFEGHKVPGRFDRRADFVTQRATRWLDQRPETDRPFFLFVHYYDPHHPYVPPGLFAARMSPPSSQASSVERLIGLYDAEIAFTDRQIGKLLEEIGQRNLADKTLVVITADHGEGLWDHGLMGHGPHIYEESLRVPLVFRWPGRIPPGQRIAAPIELTDLLPSILDLVGIRRDDLPLQGHSLASALLQGAPLDDDRPVYHHRHPYRLGRYFERFAPDLLVQFPVTGEKFGVREGVWKYMECAEEGTKELFHLGDDPREQVNVAKNFPEKAGTLAAQLRDWFKRNHREGPASADISEEDRRRLRALGYMD